jgi:hypothetical protein
MLPVLATTVVGRYSVPERLARLKTDSYRNQISHSHLNESHDMAIKASHKPKSNKLRSDNTQSSNTQSNGKESPLSAHCQY